MPHDRDAVAAARGFVFTSASAVAAAGPGAGRPAICVGPATAQKARDAGFAVTEGPGDAAGLMPLVQGLGPGWLHLRGRHVARVLPVPGIVVYDQRPQPLSPAAQALLDGEGPVILPLFSPRSAALLSAAAAGARAAMWIVAISPAARGAWNIRADREAMAASPDAQGMRRGIATLLGTEHSRGRRVEAPSGRD